MNAKWRNTGRRSFIKKSLTGLAGAAITPSLLKPETETKGIETKKEEKFIYRTLGKTGLRLPIISMGVMNAQNPHLVKAALDAGIRHLDTAWYYQNGRNEEMIGEVIKDRPRDSFIIGTKVWEPRDHRTGAFPKDAKSETFIKKFETSLKRLGLDHVDILYLHNVASRESTLFEPYLNALIKMKKEGKVRFIGVSTHQNEPEVIVTAADSKAYDVVQTAYNLRQDHHKEIDKAMEYATGKGLGIVGMKAIAGSVYNIGKKVQVDAKAALKWALQNENMHTNIPGFTTFDQMEEDLSIMEDLQLRPEEKAALEKNRQFSGLYCQQCRKCISQCPADLDIPTLMRSYMYAYGYKNLAAAKETFDGMDLSGIPCTGCRTCRVECATGFDVKNKIMDIARIGDVPNDFLV